MKNMDYVLKAIDRDILWKLVDKEGAIQKNVLEQLHSDFKYTTVLVFEAVAVGCNIDSINKGTIGVKTDVMDEKVFLKNAIAFKGIAEEDNRYSLGSMQFNFFMEQEA